MEKDSFVFRKEWKDAISGLPDEVRLEIYEAIIEYGTTGKSSDLKPMAMLAFNFAKVVLDKDSERYEEIKKKRSDAGRKHEGNQYTGKKGTNVQRMEQNGTNGTNGTDNVYESSNEDNKKTPKGVKKDAASAATLLEARKEDFYKSLIPYVTQYGKEMVRAFFDYWTEPNKSNSKMRFELERTWDVSRRLGKWASNDRQFNNGNNGTGGSSNPTATQRASDAASIVARLAAEDDAD